MKDALGTVGSLLVLGGTSEIGLATAHLLVQRGCSTVLLAVRDLAAGEEAAAALRRAGARDVQVLPYDAADPDSAVALATRVRAGVRDLDVVLVAAGVLGDQAVFDADPVAAARAVTTNYTGAVSSCLALVPLLRAQGHGTLVLLSSVAGVRTRRSNYVYGSSKAGLDAFGLGLGDALHGTGVRVMVVRPGFVHTRMTAGMPPAPLSTTPAHVAELVVAGLAADRPVVWAPRALGLLFAALRLLPRAVWRRLPG